MCGNSDRGSMSNYSVTLMIHRQESINSFFCNDRQEKNKDAILTADVVQITTDLSQQINTWLVNRFLRWLMSFLFSFRWILVGFSVFHRRSIVEIFSFINAAVIFIAAAAAACRFFGLDWRPFSSICVWLALVLDLGLSTIFFWTCRQKSWSATEQTASQGQAFFTLIFDVTRVPFRPELRFEREFVFSIDTN